MVFDVFAHNGQMLVGLGMVCLIVSSIDDQKARGRKGRYWLAKEGLK